MRKLTENEVEMLKGLSADEIMKELENIYKDDKDTLLKIRKYQRVFAVDRDISCLCKVL